MKENEQMYTSKFLVEQINLFRKEDGNQSEVAHFTLLAKIEKEFEEEIGNKNILATSYKDASNRDSKAYELNFEQALQLLMSESKTVRRRCVEVMKSQKEQIEALQKPKSQIDLIVDIAMFIKEQDTRLGSVEKQLQAIETSKAVAMESMQAIELSTDAVPEIGIRLRISQIVRVYADKTGISHRDIWNSMYRKMLYAYHFNVNAYKKLRKSESKMDIVERCNQMDNLYALVSKELIVKP